MTPPHAPSETFGICPLCSNPTFDHRALCPNEIMELHPMREIIEQVSAKVHENWMEAKRAAGVTSRKLESGEELMVPYGQLSDAAKELDRGTVRTVLDVLPTLGYSVSRS